MYNCKVIHYPSNSQVRFYKQSVFSASEKRVIDSIVESDFFQGFDGDKFDDSDLSFDEVIDSLSMSNCVDSFDFELDDVPEEVDNERSARVSASRTVQQIYYLSRSNVWDWFVTFTFNPDKVDRYDYDDCCKKLSKWLNNVRSFSPGLKYLVVPERHKDGAWHFHGLFSCAAGLEFVNSGHVDSSGNEIFNVGKYRFGFTTATRVQDTERVSKYLVKYITKDLCAASFGKKRYWASRNLDKAPVDLVSFETEEKHAFLQECIAVSKYHSRRECVHQTVDYIELDNSVELDLRG